MDHSENDKRFCVYVLKDVDGNIRYVGQGTKYRPYVKNRNNVELSKIIDRLEPEVIEDNLSKNDALAYELVLFERYVVTGLLLNKHPPSKVKEVIYEHISKYVYYDETSPTFLRWKVDVRAGICNNLLVRAKDSVAGTIKTNGYVETSINRVVYKNHRLIWVLCNKTDLVSNLVIDHLDRVKYNNKFSNLRLVSQHENLKNYDPNRFESESGFEGVTVFEDRFSVYVRWPIGFNRKSKTFNYKNLFPNIDSEVAKQKCIELAVWYKTEILNNLKKENYNVI